VQLVRQGSRNDSAPAMLRLGHLLALATRAFAPSEELRPYIATWVAETLRKAGGATNPQVVEQLEAAAKHLEAAEAGSHAPSVAAAAEIESFVSAAVHTVPVYLLDGRSEAFDPV
jgi:hypothetical protein